MFQFSHFYIFSWKIKFRLVIRTQTQALAEVCYTFLYIFQYLSVVVCKIFPESFKEFQILLEQVYIQIDR